MRPVTKGDVLDRNNYYLFVNTMHGDGSFYAKLDYFDDYRIVGTDGTRPNHYMMKEMKIMTLYLLHYYDVYELESEEEVNKARLMVAI